MNNIARPVNEGSWGVINTHPHKEDFAIENLQQQEFVVYCPMMRKRIRHARRTHDVLRPLFPSYIFVQLDPSIQNWRSILSTRCVRTLITAGERLSFLPDHFIDSLKSREVDGAIVRPEEPYRIGQQVQMSGGPFDGFIATIVDMNEKDRLVVLMDLLKQTVKVKVDVNNITTVLSAGYVG